MTAESKVKAKIDAILAKYTSVIVNPLTMGYGKSGASDKITCINGMFIAIEAKSIEAKGVKRYPTKLQYRFLQHVLEAGGCIAVVNETNYADLDALIKRVLSGDYSDKLVLFQGCEHPSIGSAVINIEI